MNSINAIEEREKRDSSFISGKISIEVLRQMTLYDEVETTTIEGFVITDNGIGFTEINMKSLWNQIPHTRLNLGAKASVASHG